MTAAESLATRRLADDEAAVARAPARRFCESLPAKPCSAGGLRRRVCEQASRPLAADEALNRKRCRVWLTRCHDPEAVLAALWSGCRVSRNLGWQMVGGEVRDGAVYLGMVYVGVGGVPPDLRKQLGNCLSGIPFLSGECRVEHVDTTIREDAADVP